MLLLESNIDSKIFLAAVFGYIAPEYPLPLGFQMPGLQDLPRISPVLIHIDRDLITVKKS